MLDIITFYKNIKMTSEKIMNTQRKKISIIFYIILAKPTPSMYGVHSLQGHFVGLQVLICCLNSFIFSIFFI